MASPSSPSFTSFAPDAAASPSSPSRRGGLTPLLPLFPGALRELLAPLSGVEEIHLRREGAAALARGGVCTPLPYRCPAGEFDRILRALLGGAPYAHEQTLREGCLLYPVGYRVGVGGRARVREGQVLSLSDVGFLIFRIPGRHPGIASPLRDLFLRLREGEEDGRRAGLLLYAPPGVGKTTVLRDLAEQLSGPPWSLHTVVADSREELFFGESAPRIPGEGSHALSVLPGWPKGAGMEAALRCMSPGLLLCDEIGGEEADALLEIGCGGLPLIATAHGGAPEELYARPALRRLLTAGVFRCLVGLTREGTGNLRFRCTPLTPAGFPEGGSLGEVGA